MKGIEGWFSEDEGRWYARFARSLRGGIFVEVGSWKGRSTSFIGRICKENGTRLICVDHWQGSLDSLRDRYSAALAQEDVEQTFRTNMAALGIEVEVLSEPSTTAAARFANGSIDRIFLDASHDAASVQSDLEAWLPKLRAPDGRLAGHDYHPNHQGLIDAVNAFAESNALKVLRGPRDIWWLEPALSLLSAG